MFRIEHRNSLEFTNKSVHMKIKRVTKHQTINKEENQIFKKVLTNQSTGGSECTYYAFYMDNYTKEIQQ